MTTPSKPNIEEFNWNYLGYLASNVRALLLPRTAGKPLQLASRDLQYLNKGRQFFESAVAGCASYSEPHRLFSVREHNVPPAATALRIAVDVYTDIHATPPLSLQDLSDTLKEYLAVIDEVQAERVPKKPDLQAGLARFLDALVQRATIERYRAITHQLA